MQPLNLAHLRFIFSALYPKIIILFRKKISFLFWDIYFPFMDFKKKPVAGIKP